MSAARTPPTPFARLSFFDGVELRRGDLHDVVGHEARMLGLHVLAAHRTWGIALGLAASLDPSSTIVTVAEGAAFTSTGDVLAMATSSIAAPTTATPGIAQPTFDLLMRAAPLGAPGCVRERTCDGVPPVVPRVELRWSLAQSLAGGATLLGDDVRLGADVPIARFVRRADGTLAGPDGSERRVVRGLVRPHVAFGQSSADELTWNDGTADIWVHIDASTSGFNTTPVYFASLGGVAASAPLVGPWLHVESAAPTGFIARLVAGTSPAQPAAAQHTLLRSAARSATIAWMGVEPTRACSSRLLSSLLDAALGGSA